MATEVLLIEDNPGDVRLTIEAFHSINPYIRISVARDGAEALEFLHRKGKHVQAPRPDLVLLDLNLPKLDGRQVLCHMKVDPRLRSIPVVILTTSTDPQDIATSYQLQANSYVRKPEQWEAFENLVRSLNDFWLTHAILPGSESFETWYNIHRNSVKQNITATLREDLQAKIDRVHQARIEAERFIDSGGVLQSRDAAQIGMELRLAAEELANEFTEAAIIANEKSCEPS